MVQVLKWRPHPRAGIAPGYLPVRNSQSVLAGAKFLVQDHSALVHKHHNMRCNALPHRTALQHVHSSRWLSCMAIHQGEHAACLISVKRCDAHGSMWWSPEGLQPPCEPDRWASPPPEAPRKAGAAPAGCAALHLLLQCTPRHSPGCLQAPPVFSSARAGYPSMFIHAYSAHQLACACRFCHIRM